MSLLPSLFRQTDIPVRLGAKVERPAPKKPDPIKEFETGDRTHGGVMLPLEYEQALRDAWREANPETVDAFAKFRAEVRKTLGVPAEAPKQAEANTAQAGERAELMQDFRNLHAMYFTRGIDFKPFEIRKAAGVAIDDRPTVAQLSRMVEHMRTACIAHDNRPQVVAPRARSWDTDPPQSPAQDAKAAKLAELMALKQQYKKMVKG